MSKILTFSYTRPLGTDENLSIILYNCQCLSTHIADLDILLTTYTPQILILTGVGSKIKQLPKISGYYWISQEGDNAFGGVAILFHKTLKTKLITQKTDFLLVELDILPKPIQLGAVYIPPGKPIPQDIFDTYVDKSFYIFGDYNAKHADWLCTNNNASGVQLRNWLDNTGCEMIYPNQPTSKRSTAVIDFGITHNADGWKAEEKIEKRNSFISQGNNIWKYVHSTFHPYAPSFKGLTTNNGIIKDHQIIADTLANYYEKHFETPIIDPNNISHIDAMKEYDVFTKQPNIPLEKITLIEVEKNWKRAQKKKSTDTEGLSAFLLHQIPLEYLQIITVAFNKIAETGEVLRSSKHAKTICLSKDGMYPEVNKLRPISLLSNFGKCFERIIHGRILKWCRENDIFIDEQSGFTAERRLQTRILSLVEDLRLATAANNRPSLVIFVDFMSAFDRMWHPALLKTLLKLEFPPPLLRWIFSWLNGRTMSIHVGNAVSRVIKLFVGTPQGSVLAATLFRLHVHFLSSYFMNLVCHLFADDLAIIISGALENTFTKNIAELERQAEIAMRILAKYADDNLLPVNINKTKALLVHDVVAPPYPKIKYKELPIEFVKRFKYLGVDITTKLGWGIYI
ncbi:unnamed protein product, partial [Rotaria socialis]